MERLLRKHLMDASDWIPTSKCIWKNHIGGKIVLKDDVATCVTTFESKIMHKLAVAQLAKDFNLDVENCPDGSKIKKGNIILSFITFFADELAPCSQQYNVFGLSLEAAIRLDHRRPNYKKLRINNEYKLHVPYFILQCVTYIETFGLKKEGIFSKVGDPKRFFELDYILTSRSEEYKFDNDEDVLEVATLLKFYLMHVQGGLFTEALEIHFINARDLYFPQKIKMLNCLIRSLPRANRETAFLILSLLRKIAFTQGNCMDSRLLSNAFNRILFRKHSIIKNKGMGALQFLIDNFTAIFTLEAENLDNIYRYIADSRPTKLHECLERRVNQCHCNPTDIPRSLLILTRGFRSYDARKVDIYRHMNHRRGGRRDDILFFHNHVVSRSISFSKLWSLGKYPSTQNDRRIEISIHSTSHDTNQDSE